MSDLTGKRQAFKQQDGLDLTRTIRKLQLPDGTSVDAANEPGRTVLLLSTNADAVKWAPRWLSQSGVTATIGDNSCDGMQLVRDARPQAVIVDAGMMAASGKLLYQELIDART